MTAMDAITKKAAAAHASMAGTKQLAIDKLEESAKLNLASMRYLSEIGIEQLRRASAIRDFSGARRFTADSLSRSGEVAKAM